MDKKLDKLANGYTFNDSNMLFIRNKNEKRVMESMRALLETDYKELTFNVIDVQDIYALALNTLSPRYVQEGSIVLREPVTKDDVSRAVRHAIETVRHRPNYTPDA